MLTAIILSRLPADLRMGWAREGEQHESDLNWLLAFLQSEIERRERSQSFVKDHCGTGVTTEMRGARVATASALQTSSTGHTSQCAVCGRIGYPVHKCFNLTKIPLSDRKQLLRNSGLFQMSQ